MDGLKHLLSAPSQVAVEDLFLQSFRNRERPLTNKEIKAAVELFKLAPEAAQELLEAVHYVVTESVYESLSAQQVVEILPADLHQKLKVLIAKIITHHLPTWKQQSVQTQASLPRLQSIDWRLDLKNAADTTPRLSGCSVIINLKVETAQKSVNDPKESKNVTFELNRDALETFLEGLGQIRDKLSGIQE